MTKPNGFCLLRFFLSAVFPLVMMAKTSAQTNNSPYSIIGIGDIEDSYFNRTSGMANTGIAYRSGRNMISNNPASFGALDNQFFNGEIGVRGKYITYYGNPVSADAKTSTDITFRKFSLATKVTNHWGSSIGLAPYSSENYEFTAAVPISNQESVIGYYEGYGGVNKAYFTNAYDLFHHLSVGVNISYLFGSISQKKILQNPSTVSTYVSTNTSMFLSNFYLDYGLQYYGKLGKKWDFTFGATFANKSDLNADYRTHIVDIDSVTLKDDERVGTFTLPTSYGLGISLTKNKKYTFVADYTFQNWSPLNYTGSGYALRDSRRISVGFEKSNKKKAYNAQYEAGYLQAGLYYNQSYVQLNGKQIEDMGVTAGFGINSKRSPMSYNVVLQYGIRGTEVNNLVEERYFSLTFIVSYHDFWFTKGRRYD